MGEFGAVSVLSGHLRGRTNTMPLYIELLYQGYDFTGAFAVSAILVLMAVIILVLRSVLEYKGQLRQRKSGRKDRNALQQKGGTDYGRFTAGHREICRAS